MVEAIFLTPNGNSLWVVPNSNVVVVLLLHVSLLIKLFASRNTST